MLWLGEARHYGAAANAILRGSQKKSSRSDRVHADRMSSRRKTRLRSSASGVHRGTVGKYDGRTKRRPRTRIASPHDGGHVIAAGVQAGNGRSIAAKHARIRISGEPRAHRDVGRPDSERVERRRRGRTDTRIGFMVGIAIETVELNFPLREINIDAGLGETVVTRDRPFELLRIK